MSWQEIYKKNGLDISVVSFSDLSERIDAEYYRPKYLSDDRYLSRHPVVRLGEISFVTDGQHGYHEVDPNSEIRFLTAKNAREWFADGQNVEHVARWVDEKNKRSSLREKDLILSTRGTVGLCALVGSEILPAQIDQDVARICLNNETDILPEFLLVYLNSEYGQDWMMRNSTGNVQQGLSLDKVRAIPIPKSSKRFQKNVSEIVLDAKAKIASSMTKYISADRLFLEEINLDGYQATDKAVSVRHFSECFAVNRFDAEYWQPKYDAIEKRAASVTQEKLGEIVSVKKGAEVGSEAYADGGKDFVRVSDFTVFGIENVEKKISNTLYESLKDNYKPKKGEVLFTKDGTIGISFALKEDIEAIVSGAFLRLMPKTKINSTYLALALNSFYCKTQIERMSGGAIIAHLKPSSAMEIKIPMLSDKKQEELANQVLEALRLRQEAKTLLEQAKRGVEIFIEKDEETALEYLKT